MFPLIKFLLQDNINDYSCTCPMGYTGRDCEVNINDCSPLPCNNGGTCIDKVNDFDCQCVAGFDGKTCNNNIDDCNPNPCHNSGKQNSIYTYIPTTRF